MARVVALCLLALTGCFGLASTPEPPAPVFDPAPASLKRLTRAQYSRSVRQVLGDVTVPQLEPDSRIARFSTIGAANASMGPTAVELAEASARAIAQQVFDSPTLRAPLLGACAADPAPRPCFQAFVAATGRRLWRRQLDDAELSRIVTLGVDSAAALGDALRGYREALTALLFSPHFLYRVELGEAGRYTSLELAVRLSYFAWGSTPDDELLDAASLGNLDSDEGLAAQADRLLGSWRAHDALTSFFEEHLTLDRLDGLSKPGLPQSSETLGPAMRTELELTVEEVVFSRHEDVRRLFDADVTYVDGELAALYGYRHVGPPEVWNRVQREPQDPRAGILTSGGFLALASRQLESSPTRRGLFIKQAVLCEEVAAPPSGVMTDLPPSQPGETTRQRSERHQSVEPCAGCHRLMDPYGYPLEAFGALGAYRTTDNGAPVNTRSTIGGVEVANARELGALLASHPKVGRCLTRELYRYATGHIDTAGEVEVLDGLARQLEAGGYRFDALVRAIVRSEGFRRAGAPQ